MHSHFRLVHFLRYRILSTHVLGILIYYLSILLHILNTLRWDSQLVHPCVRNRYKCIALREKHNCERMMRFANL